MAVQTNFRGVDMIGAAKPALVVVEEKKTAPKAKAPKATPVVEAPVVEEVVAEEVVAEEAPAIEE
jgi:hypothetical protein